MGTIRRRSIVKKTGERHACHAASRSSTMASGRSPRYSLHRLQLDRSHRHTHRTTAAAHRLRPFSRGDRLPRRGVAHATQRASVLDLAKGAHSLRAMGSGGRHAHHRCDRRRPLALPVASPGEGADAARHERLGARGSAVPDNHAAEWGDRGSRTGTVRAGSVDGRVVRSDDVRQTAGERRDRSLVSLTC